MTTPLPHALDAEKLEKCISTWEEAVNWIAKGWDDIDEYTHDVSARHTLANMLEDFSATPPSTEQQQRIAAADSRFMALTAVFHYCMVNVGAGMSPDKHWYFFRVPLDSGIIEAYENDPDFRAFLHLSAERSSS